MTPEEWRPVVGYEGLYEVSDQGRVRSLPRTLRDGRRLKGRVLKPGVSRPYGHLSVSFSVDFNITQHSVHRLVLTAFVGKAPSPEQDNALHWDGDPTNNTPGNLRWGTKKENAGDSMRHGRRKNQNTDASHCKRGHPFTEESKIPRGGKTARRCLICRYTPPPQGDKRHGKQSTYTSMGCRCHICKEGMRKLRKARKAGK